MSYAVIVLWVFLGVVIGSVFVALFSVWRFFWSFIRTIRKTKNYVLNTISKGTQGRFEVEVAIRKNGKVLRQQLILSTYREAKKLEKWLKKNMP